MRWTLIEVILMTLSIVAVVLLVGIYNIKGTFEAVEHAKLIFFAFAVISFILFTIAKFLPWTYFIHKLHLRKMSVSQSVLMMYSFFGMGMVMPVIAQFLPLSYLDRFRKNAKFSSVSLFIAINGTAALAGVLVALVSSILISTYVVYLFAIFAIFYAMASILGIKRTNVAMQRYLAKKARLSRFKIFKTLSKYVSGLVYYRGFLSQKSLVTGMLLFVPSIILESSVLFFVLNGFNQGLSFISTVFIFAVAVTVGMITFLPLGIGTMDGTMIAFLLVFGVPGIIALASTIIFRLLNTLLVGIAGYAAFFALKGSKMKNKRQPLRGKPTIGLVSLSFKGNTAVGVLEYSTRLLNALSKFASNVTIKPIRLLKMNPLNMPDDAREDKTFLFSKEATKVDLIHYLDSEFFSIGLLMHPVRLRKKPSIITVHDLFFLRKGLQLSEFTKRMNPVFRPFIRIANFLMRVGIRFAIKHADAIICISDKTLKEIKKTFKVSMPMYVIPPIVSSSFAPMKRRKKKGKIIVGHMSSFLSHKNTEMLIRAFRKTKDPRLELRLYGKYLPDHARNEPRIKYMGFVPNEKLPEIYNSFDVFVFPSLWEGFGMPIMEAKGCMVPVITFKGGEIPAIVKRNTVQFKDETDLANILEKKAWKNLDVKKAHKDIFECDERRAAKKTLDVYETILRKTV